MNKNHVTATIAVAAGLGAFCYLRSGEPPPQTENPMQAKSPHQSGDEAAVHKTDAEWRKTLTPEQYHITREQGTEPAFTGAYWHTKDPGIYRCVCCGQPLFDSDAKFDSGTGWPSFYQPIDPHHVALHEDNSHFMQRTEVTCSRCGAHLGHLFDDGPKPTGLRYCMNSAALTLKPKQGR